jgi:hypothetical protein
MAKNVAALTAALKKPAPTLTPHPAEEPAAAPYKAPSRAGKLHLSAWLSPDYKSSLRAIQMKEPNKSLQDLFSEALNDLFQKYNVPTIRED